MIPPFDPGTGALPPGDHQATLEEIARRVGFTPRRRWLLQGLRAAVEAFWAAGIDQIYIDGSFCTEKPDPGDIDSYWIEPDAEVYERIDPYWIDFELVPVPDVRQWKWLMWVDHGVEFLYPPGDAGNSGVRISGVRSAGPGRAASGHNSSDQGSETMIKSEAQRERTVAQMAGFRQALAKVPRRSLQGTPPRSAEAMKV